MIDPTEKISLHFTYHEALWLPTWMRLAEERDGLNPQVLENLRGLLTRVDEVLDHFGWKARVHCCYRPARYNALINGSRASAHLADRPGVAALDWNPIGVACESARQQILAAGLLEKLGLRCENNGAGANWIHLDSAPVPPGGHRYFAP